MPKAVVIGAGISGIAISIRLALKGYHVTVYEASAYPGGKLSEIKQDGFRFDAGPSLFTMPQYVDELFQFAGENPRTYFQYLKLDSTCKYFYNDGTIINAWSDTDKFSEEIARETTDTKQSVKKFFKKSARIYSITHSVFLERSLHQLSTYLNFKTFWSLLRFWQIDPLRTMDAANGANFSDTKTIQLFNRYATYNGSNPYQAPATLNVIPHLEHHFGAYFPDMGMNSITTSLTALAMRKGVKFEFNSPVDEILTKDGRIGGVKVAGEKIRSDLVVSNMDIWFTYRKLLPQISPPKRIMQQERSSSALIFYWGVAREFKQLDLHNIFFTQNYPEEFRHIWQEKVIYHDPTVYVNISSKLKPDDAPPGNENWFVMINVPADTGQDWDNLIAEARKNILLKLSALLGDDIEKLISCETILDPPGIQSKTSSYQGSLYGTSSNNKFAAFLRHANFSKRVKGLYFTGGSVHPGGGIPLALLSAKIVSRMIK